MWVYAMVIITSSDVAMYAYITLVLGSYVWGDSL